MTSQSTLPTAAEQGFKDAAAYDIHRPSYPFEAVEAFLKELKIAGKHGVNIVEIASGTGKFTELLAARPERYSVKAVEPHGPMRERLVEKELQSVEVLDGKADDMPIDDEWGDACITAQTSQSAGFHVVLFIAHVSPRFAMPEALKEIHRVIRPGALLGMIWNVDDYNKPRDWPATTTWERKLNEFILEFDDSLPRFRHQKWQEVFENQPAENTAQAIGDTLADNRPKFSLPLEESTIGWTLWLSEEALWDRINTLSQIAILKGGQREAAVKTFKEIIQGNDVERNEKGDIAVHGVTYSVWTSKI